MQNPGNWHVTIVSIGERVKKGEKGNPSHLQRLDFDILFLDPDPFSTFNSHFQARFYFRDISFCT